MGEVLRDESTDRARTLARLVEPVHAVTYYSREMADLTDVGYKGWWHAYFGYRPAPLGPVGPGVVTATFYNFAPRMVERAVPGVWSIRSPEQALAIRLERVTASLQRIFGDGAHAESVTAAARLVRTAVDGAEVGGRPLFAAYAELDWPDDDLIALWHGCTLLREFRGESHNLALVADEVGPVASHVLMAGRGHGNRSTILAIRGFTDEEWDEAVDGLVGSGWAHPDGTLTEAGITARSRIEAHTDVLCSGPVAALGGAFDAFVDAMIPLVTHLSDTGEVSGRWPPDHLIKPE